MVQDLIRLWLGIPDFDMLKIHIFILYYEFGRDCYLLNTLKQFMWSGLLIVLKYLKNHPPTSNVWYFAMANFNLRG